jgi:hypothetical protein
MGNGNGGVVKFLNKTQNKQFLLRRDSHAREYPDFFIFLLFFIYIYTVSRPPDPTVNTRELSPTTQHSFLQNLDIPLQKRTKSKRKKVILDTTKIGESGINKGIEPLFLSFVWESLLFVRDIYIFFLQWFSPNYVKNTSTPVPTCCFFAEETG